MPKKGDNDKKNKTPKKETSRYKLRKNRKKK